MTKIKDIEEHGPQSFQEEMNRIITTGEGLGSRKHQLGEDGNPTEEALDESQKRFLENDPIIKPMEHNEAEKTYVAEKLRVETKPFTIERALKDVESQASGTIRRPEISPLCTVDQFKRLLYQSYLVFEREYNKNRLPSQRIKLTFGENLKDTIDKLSAYFSGNPARTLNPSKGIFLYGPCGTGKSILLKMIQNVLLSKAARDPNTGKAYPMAYKIASVPHIFRQARNQGGVDFSKYFGHTYCFDDLGFDDQVVKFYGNTINPMQDILSERYIGFQSRGVLTHATSNLPWTHDKFTSMKDRLDERIISRGSEVFNFVVLDGDDFRNQQ
ncbi:MAG: hypothetical protein ACWA44_02725 [Thiotrichales bacterium]